MSRLILAAEENHKPQFGVFKAGSDSKVSRHVTDEQLERFLKTSSAKEDFKELELRQLTSLSEKGFLDLLSHPKFSKLEVLTIHDCDCVSDAVLSAIMTSNLKRLALKSLKFITPAGYIKLFKDSSLLNLERLELRSAYTVNDEVFTAFSQSQVPKLTRLDLRKCDKLTLSGLKVLGESPILPRITHLNISGCYKINGDDLKEFLNPTYLRSLRNLKMKNLTGVRDSDIECVINSEVGKQLKTLSFKNCRFSDLTYQTLLKTKMNCLTKLTIPITSWYLEEILNSPMMNQITFLEIYDIRGLIDYNIFRDKKEEYSKFDVISKRVDNILSNSKQLTNLTKLKLPSACALSKFWKSENCLKLSALDFNESDSTKVQKKKTVKKYVSMPPSETTNQILHAEKNLLIPSGADYILGKDLGHVESLFIEDIQDVYHLATVRFQQLKTLTISLKHDHGIERFAEVDMRPAKLTRLKINGIYSWTFFTDVLPLSKNFAFLQSIKIGMVGISGNYIEAFKNLRAMKFLKKITFSQGSISVSALSAIIANVPELEEISLRDCTLEEEVEPNVEELIDFKGLIKTHREHFFQNIYLQPCTFRLLVKNRFSGGYSDERTQVLSLSKIKDKPYGNFPIILSENPAWNNEGDGGYDKLTRTLHKFQEYYKKDSRNLNWIKTLDTKNSSLDNMVYRVILDKCVAMRSLRYCNGGVNALSAFPEALESLQSLTVRFLPELDDIKLFGPFLSTIFIYTDRSKSFAALKTLFEAMTTNEKSKNINSFILWEFGNSAGREICPFGEVMNLITSTPIKDFRYFEVPNYKFDFTPENKEALKTILTQLTTLKYNQTLLLSLLAKFLSLFEKHLQTCKEDDDKDALVVEYFAQLFRDSTDIAEILCFYAINYKENWLRRAIMKITASMPMTPEELKKFYIREIWDVTFTEISFLKDESEIHNPLAIEYAFKDFQNRPDDKIVLRIIDKVFTNLTAEQLKALPKTTEHASIFRHPLFYDPNHPWTFAEYSLKFRDLDSFLGKHSQSIPKEKKIILWEKVKSRFVEDHFNQVDFSRVKELAIKFPRISRDIFQRVESFDLKTITIQVEMGNEREYNIPKKAISKAMYQKLERINIEIYNLSHVSAEPWAWFVDILDNIKSECTLDISIENNGKVVVPLEIQERSSVKVKTLILQGKASFNFFSELHTRMKLQTLECQEIKIKRKPLDNWDEEKTDENEKKILAYIGKMKGTLNHIRLDIPLKLNSLISILQTPQWLQIKNFRIMSSGTNEELELIARAKNLSRLKTLHIDFSQRITHGESLTLYLQGIKALLSGARGSLKSLDWGRFFSVHSKYGLICHEIIKEAIKRNIFKEPSFQQWTLGTPHHKFAILPETVTKVLENADVKNFDIVQFIAQNKGHPAITPRVYCYYVTGQFRDKILSLCAGTTPIIFQDKQSQTHTSLIDLLNTNHFTQAHLDDMIETQPLSIDDDFISIMCTFADVIKKHQIVIRKLDKKHKSITSTGLNQLIKTFPYQEFPSLYKWVVGSSYYLQMADLDNLEMLSTRDIKFFDIKKLRLSNHKFLSPYSEMEMEASEIIAQRDASNLMGQHHSTLSDNAKNRRDTAILGLICQCQSLQWLHLDNLNLDDVFCTRLAVLHNEKLKNKNKLQLISIKENPYITYVGLKFLYSMPIADEAFQQSHYGIIANCEVILDIPEVVVLNDGIHAAVKSKFREYKRKKKARGLRYFDNACIPLIIYSIVCFPFAFFQYFDDEINETKYLRKIRTFVTKIGDKVRGLLNMQLKKAEYEYFDDMEDEQDKASGSRLQYIFSKGCIKLNAFFRRRYVWALLYGIHAVLYYFFAIFFPLKFVHECNSTEKNYSHIAYAIYAGVATISEALLLRKSIKTINNDQVAQFKWVAILVPLAISQNNKLSLYTDVLYLTTAFSCGSHTKGLISTISIGIFLFMNAVQIFNLLEEYIKIRRNSKTHNSTYIDSIAKFCYSVDLTSISSFLEKISICCADQVGRTYVPQILQTIGLKCMTVTFPQAILQLSSYLASDLSKSSMIYLVSFVVSIVNLILAFYALITAQPSACTPATVKKVFYKDFATQLKQVERAPTKRKPKKISPKVVDAGTLTAKQDKKMRLFECFNSLKCKIASLFARKEAKVCEAELTTVKDAAKMARLVRYEQEVAKLKAKYNRKGKVSGYYVQGGECPIEGTYCLVDGILDMRTKDTVGIAKWDGVISIFTGVARIAKRYDGNHFVGYNGDINWDNEADVEVNGLWSIGGSGDRFKLTFYREDEIEKKLDAEPAKPDEPAESDVPDDQAEESSLIEGEEGDYQEEDPEEDY